MYGAETTEGGKPHALQGISRYLPSAGGRYEEDRWPRNAITSKRLVTS